MKTIFLIIGLFICNISFAQQGTSSITNTLDNKNLARHEKAKDITNNISLSDLNQLTKQFLSVRQKVSKENGGVINISNNLSTADQQFIRDSYSIYNRRTVQDKNKNARNINNTLTENENKALLDKLYKSQMFLSSNQKD